MRAAEWYVGGWGKRKKRVRSSALVHTICWMRARVNEHTRYACVMIAGFLRLGQRIMTQTARPFPAEYILLEVRRANREPAKARARLTLAEREPEIRSDIGVLICEISLMGRICA